MNVHPRPAALQRMQVTWRSVIAGAAGAAWFLAAGSCSAESKPSEVAEDFFAAVSQSQYHEAAAWLSSADHAAAASGRAPSGKLAGHEARLEKMLADAFVLLHPQPTTPPGPAGDQETIMPRRVAFFVPGQHYVQGPFAVVFTREQMELAPADAGPVRDDPRKLWVDPTNELSKVRDEAFFKQWWAWEGDRVTIPGLIWMIHERDGWKIDLIAGKVPRKDFAGILRWHFGRDIFEVPHEASPQPASGARPPAGSRPAAR